MTKKDSQPVKVFLRVCKDGWTKLIQVEIGDSDSGYRLYGPKFNGSSTTICDIELSESDVKEIRSYLDEAYPKKRKISDKSC